VSESFAAYKARLLALKPREACHNCGEWLEPGNKSSYCQTCHRAWASPNYEARLARRAKLALAIDRNRPLEAWLILWTHRTTGHEDGTCPVCGSTHCHGDHVDCLHTIIEPRMKVYEEARRDR
jgi:RNA polymerase subunit RPABC4/transcription elongation factor Spt4